MVKRVPAGGFKEVETAYLSGGSFSGIEGLGRAVGAFRVHVLPYDR